MATEFWFENQDKSPVRDFILTALAKGQEIYSSEQGFAAADDPSEIEGEGWKLLSSQQALDSIPSDSEGCGWSIGSIENDPSADTESYFMFGGNTLNWLWYVPATEEWLTDSDGNTCDPSRYMAVGRAADFIEEQARYLAAQ